MEASLGAKKLARNSSAIGVPKGSSDFTLSSRYKNGKDPMPSSRYKANSRYVSIEAYPFALPCGERIEGERIDASVVDIKTERIRCPAVDIKKRTGDPSPLESSPEGETDRCVLESDGRLLV